MRDVLLGAPNLDLDIVLEGSAIRMGQLLSSRLGGRLTVHKRFHTAVWHIADHRKQVASNLGRDFGRRLSPEGLPPFLDLITARQETYARPGALPEVHRAKIKEDLFRRDFTVNTLTIRLFPSYSEFLDLWGGYNDLRLKQLRTLHPRSFSDDPTRILRILRLAGRLGFQSERKTLGQLKGSLGDLKRVSPQRIYNELFLILQEEKRVPI
ncbi:MAG: CBS domain-containing protein, partial [Anaerolineales bacterium]